MTTNLQKLITEKFQAGEGEQTLNITVVAVSETNVEVLIDGDKYSVVENGMFHVDAAPVLSSEVENAAIPTPETEESIAAEAEAQAATEVPAEDGNTVADVAGENVVSAPAEETTGTDGSTEGSDGQVIIDRKFQEVMTHFQAEDVQPTGEQAESGEDKFSLIDIAGEVVATGTLRELEDQMNAQLSAPKPSEG